MNEQSIAAARASVMIYDDNSKKWIPSGTSSGLSKVHIYQHQINNSFRVVGRKLHDHEVVINCSILKGLKYNQATQTFHQWRDNKQVYGLNFSSKEDADAFAMAMMRALELLNSSVTTSVRVPLAPAAPPQMQQQQQLPQIQQPPIYQHINNGPNSDYEDIDLQQRMRGAQRDDNSSLDRRMAGQQSPGSGHHRTSSAPPAPAPAPAPAPTMVPPPPPPPAPAPTPPAPPAPPVPPAPAMMIQMPVASSPCLPPPTTAPPPPPPPPVPSGGGAGTLSRSNSSDDNDASGTLANALANARLRKTSRGSDSENLYGSLRGSVSERPQLGGMASMMDEMAKTLARRRAAVENQNAGDGDNREITTPDGKKPWDKTNGTNGSGKFVSSNGAESPKPGRRQRFGSISGSDDLKLNGTESLDLDRLKSEIVMEIKKEMNKMKQDIIDAIRMELSRR